MTATILPFPPRPAQPAFPRTHSNMRHVTLLRLSGELMATAGFLPGDPGAPWAWICEVVAAEYECHEEDVHVLECMEEGDLITAEGIPVCRVAL